MEPELLRIREVQKVLAVGRSMVYYLMDSGKLKSVKIGKARRVRRQDLDDFVASLS